MVSLIEQSPVLTLVTYGGNLFAKKFDCLLTIHTVFIAQSLTPSYFFRKK